MQNFNLSTQKIDNNILTIEKLLSFSLLDFPYSCITKPLLIKQRNYVSITSLKLAFLKRTRLNGFTFSEKIYNEFINKTHALHRKQTKEELTKIIVFSIDFRIISRSIGL